MTEPSVHDRWVSSGRCPAIHRTKAWCNGEPSHLGLHWAPYLLPGGETSRSTWSDADCLPSPSTGSRTP